MTDLDLHRVHILNEQERYLLETQLWNRAYDERADRRREAWLADRFTAAVQQLFNGKL